MVDGIAGWRFFDAESGHVPDDFSPSVLPGGGAGRIVALAATPFARSEGWAAEAVVVIAKSWSAQELRIFLMDLGLDEPSLHETLGLANEEGVSDAFLYGASVQRIAIPALDGAIFFASAGTATTDPEQILAHPRWNDLAGGFSEADATLLLFLPTDIPGAEKILSRATDVLFLAGEEESAEDHLGPAAVKVVASLGPQGSPPADHGEPEDDEPVQEGREDQSAFEALTRGEFGLAGDLGGGGAGDEEESAHPEVRLKEDFLRETEVASEIPDSEKAGDPVPDGLDEPDASAAFEDGYVGPRENLLGVEEPVIPSLDEGPVWSDGEDEIRVDAGGATEEEDASGPLDIPDFGAEFADLPDLDPEPAVAPEADSDEMGDLVPGSEFTLPPHAELDESPRASDQETADEAPPRKPPYGHPPDRTKPRSKLTPPPRKKFRVPLLAGIAAVLLLLTSAVGTAMGLVSVPGLRWLQGMFGEVPPPALTVAGAEPVDANLRFSLELDVFEEEELGIAVEMRNTLQGRLPDLLFTLTPLGQDGLVNYVLHAGPATDVVEAENLRPRVAEVLFRDDPESWAIRTTPRGFLLGQAGTLAQAEEILSDAEARGGLAYVLESTYPDGQLGYQVFSGAFYGVEDARYWQLFLRDAGFKDVPLIERRGRPVE